MNRQAVDSIEREIAQEKAESLGLSGRTLEDALRALREFDERCEVDPDGRRRAALVARAADRVTNYLVQREAHGLRDSEYVFRFFRVPREVVARLGIVHAGH
jgi:hypothetical protein